MLSGYKKHKDHESAPPPLTDQELELELVKQQEVRKRISLLLKAVTMCRLKSRTEKKKHLNFSLLLGLQAAVPFGVTACIS